MENLQQRRAYSVLLASAGLLGLALVYIFQQIDYLNVVLSWMGSNRAMNPNTIFVVNKTLRLILNDLLCFVLIYALFKEKKYLRIAFFVFCFELCFILPLYFIVKLSLEGDSEISSPLLSQIHRLIVNPMLMILLIIAFYYQRFWAGRRQQ